MSISPAIVARESTCGVPATDVGSSTPLRRMRRRPTRSVIRMLPSGRNARLHGCESPFVTTLTLMSRCSNVDDIQGPSPSGGDGRGRGPGGMTPRWSRITGYGNRFASSSVAGDNCGGPCCEAWATATATPIVSADTNITLIAFLCGVPVSYHERTDSDHWFTGRAYDAAHQRS